jgi:hypothetical protein
MHYRIGHEEEYWLMTINYRSPAYELAVYGEWLRHAGVSKRAAREACRTAGLDAEQSSIVLAQYA